MKRKSWGPAGDQPQGTVSIIVNRRIVRQRQIKMQHVPKPGTVAPANYILRDEVPALAHPPRNAGDCILRGWNPEIDKGNAPPSRPAFLQQPNVGLACASGLKSKARALSHQITHPLDHQPAGLKGDRLNVARGDLSCNLIRVEKRVDAQVLRQKYFRRRRLARSVWATENDEVFDTHYAGTSSFLPPFFSTTGPWVSTVGGGGASPMRLE